MPKFTFHVGVMKQRTVTVVAPTLEAANIKAREKLDALAEKQGDAPPVCWDLTLKSG